MATVILLRHGRTGANASGVLAGWTPGVELDDTGRVQAAAVAERLRPVPLAVAVTSPLERCRQTIGTVLAARDPRTGPVAAPGSGSGAPAVDDRLGECHYGDWTNRPIKELVKDPLWKVVQQHPSAMVFPGPAGESLAHTQARAVTAVREWDARVTAEHGEHAVWLACSHGDVIKSIVADAFGMHLDLFQRIVVDPCSVTVIRYSATRPFVVRVNDTGGDVTALLPPPPTRRRRRRGSAGVPASDAVLGGGAGA